MRYLFKFVSRQLLLYPPASQITTIFCPDLYYLGLPNDPLYRKVLVYGVYAAELVQTILYSKKGFQEFAIGFGDILALEDIGLLWFAAPVLTAIGVYNPFLGHFPLAYKVNKCRSSSKSSMHTESKYSLNHISFHPLLLW